MTTARVLTVAGSDSGGGAGIAADLATLTSLGVKAGAAVTAVTAQDALEVGSIKGMPADLVVEQIVRFGLRDVDAVKTGMLHSAPIVLAVARSLTSSGSVRLVVDPVMESSSGTSLMGKGGKDALVNTLIPVAEFVTPNLREASALTDGEVTNLAEMRDAARVLFETGARHVLITGGHLAGPPVDLYYDGKDFSELRGERLEAASLHGSGCVLSAALAAYLALGESALDAARKAKYFTARAIRFGSEGSVDPAWMLRRSRGGAGASA